MTNTKTLESIYAIAATLPAEQQQTIHKLVDDNVNMANVFKSTETLIAELILQLNSDIATGEAKSSGKNNQLKAMKYILSQGKKAPKEYAQYVKTIDGWQYASDGFMLAKIKPLNLPECPERLGYLDVKSVLNGNRDAYNELVMPDAVKLKAYIKQQKALHKADKKYKSVYNFGKDKPLVDAECLSTVIDLMEGKFKAYYKNTVCAIYLKDEHDNEALLCPIRRKEGFVDEVTKL